MYTGVRGLPTKICLRAISMRAAGNGGKSRLPGCFLGCAGICEMRRGPGQLPLALFRYVVRGKAALAATNS